MIIAVVGAGGKTTLSNHLGKSLARMGRRVLFTTTTKIFMPTDSPLYLGPAENIRSSGLFLTAAKGVLENGKLEGYTPEDITAIAKLGLFDDIIVEADGAARKPVKAPNETEPVYPASVHITIGVIGLDCLAQPVNEAYVHRASLFSRVTGAAFGEPIASQHIIRLIRHPEGLFRHVPDAAPKVVFLNKCDIMDEKVKHQAEDIIRESPYPVIVTGYHSDWFGDFYRQFYKGDCNAH